MENPYIYHSLRGVGDIEKLKTVFPDAVIDQREEVVFIHPDGELESDEVKSIESMGFSVSDPKTHTPV